MAFSANGSGRRYRLMPDGTVWLLKPLATRWEKDVEGLYLKDARSLVNEPRVS